MQQERDCTLPPKQKPKPIVQGRVELQHGVYRIVAGLREEACQAIAYLGTQKIEARNGETIEAAVDSLKAALDERAVRLRRDRVQGVPSAAEFREALIALEASRPEPAVALLASHGCRPDAIATLGELARLGDRDESTTATVYARLGRKLGTLLDFAPPTNGHDRTLAPIQTFAVVTTLVGGSGVLLQLRPEVAAALGTINRKDHASQS